MPDPMTIEEAEHIAEILTAIGENRRHVKHSFLRIQESIQRIAQHRGLEETYTNVMAIATEIGTISVPKCPFDRSEPMRNLDDEDLLPTIIYARSIAIGILLPMRFFGEGASQTGAQRLDSYFKTRGMFPKKVVF